MIKGVLIDRIMSDTQSWISIELRQISDTDYRVYQVRHLSSWGIPPGRTELYRCRTLQEGQAVLKSQAKLTLR